MPLFFLFLLSAFDFSYPPLLTSFFFFTPMLLMTDLFKEFNFSIQYWSNEKIERESFEHDNTFQLIYILFQRRKRFSWTTIFLGGRRKHQAGWIYLRLRKIYSAHLFKTLNSHVTSSVLLKSFHLERTNKVLNPLPSRIHLWCCLVLIYVTCPAEVLSRPPKK